MVSNFFQLTYQKTNMKHFSILIILATALLYNCAEESDPEYEKQNFTSIFDNNQFSAAFHPVDFKQTADGGYLILAERKIPEAQHRGIYLLKADQYGNFVKELSVDEQYVNPVAELMSAGDQFYFFGMNAFDLQAQIIKVDANIEGLTITPVAGMTYPAAASADGADFLLLSYNHVDKNSVFSKHALDGDLVMGPRHFGIGAGDEVEEPIMNHFIGTGKKFPFKVGKITEGLYFFNGFQNYTFSVVFSDLEQDDALGVIHGQQDDGGFSSLIPLGGSRFAASRFNFGENYFLPDVTLQTNALTTASELGGNVLPELIPDAPVTISRVSIDSKDVLIYASDTKSKQIGLYFYDEPSGEFISSRYLGFSNPFEVAGVIQTSDDGIAVCGTTWLGGRFPRICLFKISKDDLSPQFE
jgi:hypothetical protein